MTSGEDVRFSEAVLVLQECDAPANFASALLHSLRTLCEADAYTVNSIGPTQFGVFASSNDPSAADMAVFNAYLHEHPLTPIIERAKGGGNGVGRWSDYLPLREIEKTALWREYFREIGVRWQLGAAFCASPHLALAFAFNRSGLDFHAEDAKRLERFIPHARALSRRMLGRMELDHALAMREVAIKGNAVMVVDEHGALIYASEHARRLTREYFPLRRAEGLPVEMQAWLRGGPGPGAIFIQYLAGRRLECAAGHPTPREGDFPREIAPPEMAARMVRRLTLTEFDPAQAMAALQKHGLTGREAEVLHWMAEGKRNGEIAIILQVSARTVDKHRENLFAKLEIETRTAAVQWYHHTVA